jgi:hypothetical protein
VKTKLITGGFLMGKFRRGVDQAKLYPVVDTYMPVPQNEPVTQQAGIVESPPKI